MRISDWSSDVCSSDLTPASREVGADDRRHRGDPVGGEPGSLRMLADQSFAGGVVDAVDAVAGDIAVPPLDVRIHGGEDRVRMLRRIRELLRRHRAGVRDIAFDQEPWPVVVLVPWASGVQVTGGTYGCPRTRADHM